MRQLKPTINTLAYMSKVIATKQRATIKSFDPTLLPFLKVIKESLADDDVLLVINKQTLDYIYGMSDTPFISEEREEVE
jgi:hypothetical protein